MRLSSAVHCTKYIQRWLTVCCIQYEGGQQNSTGKKKLQVYKCIYIENSIQSEDFLTNKSIEKVSYEQRYNIWKVTDEQRYLEVSDEQSYQESYRLRSYLETRNLQTSIDI